MMPQTSPPPEQNSTRVNLLISLTFHAAIVLALTFFAAHEGLLGKQLKKIAVEMVKETPPEKPKEPPKPKIEPPKMEPPKLAEVPKVEAAKVEPLKETRQAAPVAAASAVAPAAAELPSFEFGGGKTVQTSSDPVLLYGAAVEAALRSNWRRPANIADDNYVAEVEVAVDHAGHLSDPIWKRGSGDARWDDSVRQAISAARDLNRPPPANFPVRVLVRFDVQDIAEPIGVSE
jgi:outer membrane biosynthesis protein TonB